MTPEAVDTHWVGETKKIFLAESACSLPSLHPFDYLKQKSNGFFLLLKDDPIMVEIAPPVYRSSSGFYLKLRAAGSRRFSFSK